MRKQCHVNSEVLELGQRRRQTVFEQELSLRTFSSPKEKDGERLGAWLDSLKAGIEEAKIKSAKRKDMPPN